MGSGLWEVAERRRAEAEARAAALEAEVATLDQVSREQQEAIEELHNAWRCVQLSNAPGCIGSSGVGDGGIGSNAPADSSKPMF